MTETTTMLMTAAGDVLVTARSCGHCGAVPTEDEMVAALRKWMDERSRCSVCGELFCVKFGRISHGEKEWYFYGDDPVEPVVTARLSLSAPGNGLPDIHFHVSCLTRAFPRHPWPTMLFPETR